MYCVHNNIKRAIATVETRKRWYFLRTRLFNVVEKLGEEETLRYVNLPYSVWHLFGFRCPSDTREQDYRLAHNVAKLTYTDANVNKLVGTRGQIDEVVSYNNCSFVEHLKQWSLCNGSFDDEGVATWEDVESLLRGKPEEDETVYTFVGCNYLHIEHHEAGKYNDKTTVYTPEKFIGENSNA